MADGVRHKCFISYHQDDKDAVEQFITTFDQERKVFIPRCLGIMDQAIIDSNDRDYVMRRIRELYLAESTVTIVMVGKCTWARRYVDWEIASTLRNDAKNKRSGLMAITLPYMANRTRTLPPRFQDNLDGKHDGSGYARWYVYPTRKDSLANWIDDAFQARDTRAHLINNSRALFGYNRTCG